MQPVKWQSKLSTQGIVLGTQYLGAEVELIKLKKMEELNVIGQKAKKAASQLAHLNTEQKNGILIPGGRICWKRIKTGILEANARGFETGREHGPERGHHGRLTLTARTYFGNC